MNTYLTGNALGSTSAKDLYDNSSNFDDLLNGLDPVVQDRFLRRRQSWQGLQNLVNDSIASIGFEATHLTYVDGNPLVVQRPTQLIDRAGFVYKIKQPATFPFTLTGTFATDAANLVDVGDASLRSSLANMVDLTQGANLVGRAAYTFNSVAQMTSKTGRYDGDICILLGYYSAISPGSGGGILRWNATSTSTVGLDGQRFKVIGVPTGCWERFNTGVVSILDWGAISDPSPTYVSTNNVAFAAARDYVAATLSELMFPAGSYCYTISPNWAINRAIITSSGRVDLIYSGTGNAVLIDAGATALDLVFDMRMGYFTVKVGNSAAQESVYVRSVHHGKLDFNIRSAGAGKAALKVDFAVCTEFNIISSNNEEGGWYLGLAPAFGMRLCQRLVGEQVAYSYFPNAIIEHQNTGIQIEQGLGNTFIGGTSEGCVHGIILQGGALRNKILGMDFEANSTADIECSGNENEFVGCDTERSIFIGGSLNKISGGSHQDVVVNVGAGSNKLIGFTYNRSTVGGTLLDSGTNTRMADLTNGASGLMHDSQPGVQSITVGASPFTFGNNRGNNVMVFIIGGTTVTATVTRSGGSPNPVPVASTGAMVMLSPGDLISVAYASAPTMYYSKL